MILEIGSWRDFLRPTKDKFALAVVIFIAFILLLMAYSWAHILLPSKDATFRMVVPGIRTGPLTFADIVLFVIRQSFLAFSFLFSYLMACDLIWAYSKYKRGELSFGVVFSALVLLLMFNPLVGGAVGAVFPFVIGGFLIEIFGMRGVEVIEVVPGSPVEEAGIGVGDVITRIDEREIRGLSDFSEAIEDVEPGQVLVIGLEDGSEATVVLSEHPQEAGKGFLGVYVKGRR